MHEDTLFRAELWSMDITCFGPLSFAENIRKRYLYWCNNNCIMMYSIVHTIYNAVYNNRLMPSVQKNHQNDHDPSLILTFCCPLCSMRQNQRIGGFRPRKSRISWWFTPNEIFWVVGEVAPWFTTRFKWIEGGDYHPISDPAATMEEELEDKQQVDTISLIVFHWVHWAYEKNKQIREAATSHRTWNRADLAPFLFCKPALWGWSSAGRDVGRLLDLHAPRSW